LRGLEQRNFPVASLRRLALHVPLANQCDFEMNRSVQQLNEYSFEKTTWHFQRWRRNFEKIRADCGPGGRNRHRQLVSVRMDEHVRW